MHVSINVPFRLRGYNTCMTGCEQIWMRICVYASVFYVRARVCVCTYARMYAYVYICTYVRMYVGT